MKSSIAKSDWLSAQECMTKAWREFRLDSLPSLGEAALFRMEQGRDIGQLARTLFPGGVFVFGGNGKTAAEATQDHIRAADCETLFEATFHAAPFVAKVDILCRNADGWHVLEVKSTFSESDRIDNLVEDLAYTVFVLRRSGERVTKASLVLLSRGFQFGDLPARLFEIVDKTAEANTCISRLERSADTIARAFFDPTPPKPWLVSVCRSCRFFRGQCLGIRIARTVLEIPGLHHKKLKLLSEAGIVDLALIPEDLGLNECQLRAIASALSGKLIVEPGLRTDLASLEWPCHYLDFETVATVLPLYEGHGCHRQVLTQFSIHHRSGFDAEPTHGQYLADAGRDCERDLTKALIDALGDRGSIVVYSDFEKTRIKALQASFPEYSDRLEAILGRLKNFLPFIEAHVYHPNFEGSFSIKKVLPALVPELSYEKLDVADGDTAITRFARMARGEIQDSEVPVVRQQLLDYCKMDTLAMVRLHEALHRLASDGVANTRAKKAL